MKLINRVCLTIALLCVFIGSTVAILAIWGIFTHYDVVWRSLATLGVIFLSTILTRTASKLA